MQAVDRLNGPAGIARQLQGGTEKLAALFDHLTAPAVQGCVDEDGRAGGAQQIGARVQFPGVHQVALQMEDGNLFESGPSCGRW
jgi:hypothetical protein